MTNLEITNKIYQAETKINRARAVFEQLYGNELLQAEYDIDSADELTRTKAYVFLERYPIWSNLLSIAYEYIIDGYDILRELQTEIPVKAPTKTSGETEAENQNNSYAKIEGLFWDEMEKFADKATAPIPEDDEEDKLGKLFFDIFQKGFSLGMNGGKDIQTKKSA